MIVKDLEQGDDPGLFSWAQWNHKVLIREWQEGHKQNGDGVMLAEAAVMHFEDGGKSQEWRNAGGYGRHGPDSPLKPPEGTRLANALILAHNTISNFWPLDNKCVLP